MDIKSIPVLNSRMDSFVRFGFYGGCTDLYQKYGQNLHYYDVNSLYPTAMLKPMPIKPLEWLSSGRECGEIDIKSFFGYALVKVTAPNSLMV